MVKVKLLYYLSWENKFVNPNGKIDLKRNFEAVGNAINDQFDSISKLANPNGQTYFETSVNWSNWFDLWLLATKFFTTENIFRIAKYECLKV